MTSLWGSEKLPIRCAAKYERIEKVTGSRDDKGEGGLSRQTDFFVNCDFVGADLGLDLVAVCVEDYLV
jgi:hypothetical protein